MYCRKCGAQISDDAKYCTICGAPTAGGVQTQKQGSNIAVRIVIGIVVWFGSMVLMALIGMALGFGKDGKDMPGFYALAVVLLPVLLAMLAAMPEKMGLKKSLKPEQKTPTSTQSRKGASASPNEYRYVINPETMVVHRPSCRYAQDISYGNKHWAKDLKSCVDIGYRPCKYCKPK